MVKELSKRQIDRWNDTMSKKLSFARGESIYKDKGNLEGLMADRNPAWVKYRNQQKAELEHKAELAKIDNDMSTQEKVKVFKSLAESYGASLYPRMSWEEIDKVVKSSYEKMLEEAGIKEISVPSYRRYERRESIEEKGKVKKYTSWTERKKNGLSGVPQEFLDNKHNDDDELIDWFWRNHSRDDLLEELE